MNQTFHWTTADGLKIYGHDWSVENPKAVFCLIHGFGEHCERYHHVAEEFNRHGYAFVGYDRRGHGKSEGKRGHTTGFDAFLDEITDLIQKSAERYPGVPQYFYAHSMGANLALNYLIRRQPDIKGAIVTGTWIRLGKEPPGILKSILKLINAIYPSFTQTTPLYPDLISTIPEEAQKYGDDPLNHGEMTAATATAMFDACKYLENYKGQFPVPLLMLHGSGDKLIDPQAAQRFAERVSGDVQFKSFVDQAHEIHNDRMVKEVFSTAIAWANTHTA